MTDRADNVTSLPSSRSVSGNGGDGNGRDLHGRLSAIEAHFQHAATKEDIRRLEGLISQREASMLRWLIGILAVASISLAVALFRSFAAGGGHFGM